MKYLKVIVVVIVVAIISFAMFLERNNSASIQNEKLLREELSSIEVMPGALADEMESSRKGKYASASIDFHTMASYEEIQKYYQSELKTKGWNYDTEEKVTDWGKDLGGKILKFKKKDYSIDLQYAGEKASYGWNYAITITWGHLPGDY